MSIGELNGSGMVHTARQLPRAKDARPRRALPPVLKIPEVTGMTFACAASASIWG